MLSAIRRAHDDIRVEAFLRALSIVGMVTGLVSFVLGINPFLAAVVLPGTGIQGPAVLKMAVLGILVYCISLAYYNATGGFQRTDLMRL
ncbi:hypothetical protein GJ629_14000 [Halapricum sp. CBA1109]|nr:hypothetical protein [Halapricum sp. CBA1109]